MQRIAKRDSRALEQLYNLTVGHVYGLALRITGRPETARQVTEDVFVRAWDTTLYDPALGSPVKWLLLVCRSCAREALIRPDDSIGNPVASNLQDLGRATKGGAPLHEAIKKLLPQQRRLLNLAFFREMNCEELAIHAGLQESTVKSLMSSTMSLLRKELADDA